MAAGSDPQVRLGRGHLRNVSRSDEELRETILANVRREGGRACRACWRERKRQSYVPARLRPDREPRSSELEEDADGMVTNQHGVRGAMLPGIARACFVPECCLGCEHFDGPEMGDYGSVFGSPCCGASVWFPSRTGRCGKRR
jgi:hypothetical protein